MEAEHTALVEETEEVDTDIFQLKKEPRPFDAALFGETIRQGFSKLFGDTNTTDLVLVVGPSKVPVHRMVLCAWSETFRAMLEGTSWSESTLKELPIHIEEDEYEVFHEIVKYMYTGQSEFIEGSNIVTVIALANYYGIHSLKEVCGKLLGDLVSPANLFYLLDIVDKYDCRELELMCGQYLAGNFSTLWEIDDSRLLALRPETWSAMLKSDELSASSEQVIYEAVLAYANQFMAEEEKRDSTLKTLLPLVRWNYLPASYLMEKVEQELSIAHLPIVEKLLYEVYRFGACPAAQPSFCARPRTGFQRFDVDHKGPNIKLDEDMCVAETTHSGWETVRCLIPLSASNPFVEFEIVSSSNMMLGVAEESCGMHSYAGEQATGHVLHGSDGNFYNGGNSSQKSLTFGAGDKIGIFADLEAGTLEYFKNGKKGFIYNAIPKGKPMYPVASFAGSNKVKLSLTPVIPKELEASMAATKKALLLPKPKHS